MTVPTQMYNFILRSIRDMDQQEGYQFLERYFMGFQSIWESIDAALFAIPDLWSATDCPDKYLQYLKWIVGWTSELDYITSNLSDDELRKLIAISGRLWKLRGTEDTIIDVLKFATGARCRYLNWFDYRWILDETIFGEEHDGRDPWMIALPDPLVAGSEYISTLRIVDNGTLNKELVANLLELMRATGEQWEIFYLGFLDQFIVDNDTTQWRAPIVTATNVFQVTDGKLQLGVTAVGNESTETIVAWASWNQMVVGARIRCFPLGTAMTFQIRFHYIDSDNYYALEVLPTSHASGPELKLIKVLSGTPSTLDSIDPGFPIYDEIWYYYRISIVDVWADKEIKVYIDSVELINTIDVSDQIGTGNIGLLSANGTIDVDEVELFEFEEPMGEPFTTEWTVAGDAAARTITLPLVAGYNFNFVADWGDDTTPSLVTAYNDANRIHTYPDDGTYIVKIYGVCEGWSFNNGGDRLKITKVIHWGSAPAFEGFKYLAGGFYGCSNLSSIGTTPIPASGTGILSNGFSNTFRATGITSIPSGLFDNNPQVTTFTSAFRATAITSIPSGLFDYNTAVISFSYTFMQCSLVSIPSGLFDNNTQVINFKQAFYGCSALETTPSELFRFNTLCTDFSNMFKGCIKHQQNIDLFYQSGGESTRFLNQSVDFTSCFDRDSFTGTQGTAPDLWNCDFGTGTPTTTGCWAGAGNSTTSLTNYTSIPSAWGGPA